MTDSEVVTMETESGPRLTEEVDDTANDAVSQESEEDGDDYQVEAVKPEKKLQRPKTLTIPELLAIRQGYGVSSLALPPFARPRNLVTSTLASRIAWNPSRLQNMILTVGPGTPAAIIDLTVEPSPPPASTTTVVAAAAARSGSSAASSSSSSDSSSGNHNHNSSSSEDDDEEEEDNISQSEDGGGNSTRSPMVLQQPPSSQPQLSSEDDIRRPPSSVGSSSGSSSSTTSPKRTLSDRMKMPEDDDAPPTKEADTSNDGGSDTKPTKTQKNPKYSMNLDTTSDDDDDDDSSSSSSSSSDDEDQSQNNEDPKDVSNPPEAKEDEEMQGYSDIEKELLAKDKEENDNDDDDGEMKMNIDSPQDDNDEKTDQDDNNDKEEEEDDEEPLPELTARERFYLEVNQEEENRMHFSTDEEEEDDDDESEDRPLIRRPAESTDEDREEDDDDEEEDQEMADFREMAAEWFALEQAAGGEDDDEEEGSDDDNDDDDDSDEDRAAARIIIRRRILRRSPSPTRRSNNNNNNNESREMKPSLRHGGCINTAAWLQAGWRLSTVSSQHYSTSYNANYCGTDDAFSLHAITTDDCPTQLVTSGDDRKVKFWDVRHAMGSSNPLPWGRNTYCPFASNLDDCGAGYKARWRDFYYKQKPVEPWKMYGNVLPLAALQTGHRGNVFHVTPLWQKPGKVATCGADGYLRLGDVEAGSSGDSNSSSIIISPEHFDDGSDHMMRGFFSLRPGMCFSHHFLNSNVGLLCSERGLRRFDVRLPPRQQERRALLGGDSVCKACAVWSVSSTTSVEEVDSTYVFVGGTGADVALCDLRMSGSDASDSAKVVCQYRPKSLHGNEEVSVSGLDLSRDKKELLVSYESDQIYTFPIFPNAKSAAGPTLEEIGGLESHAMMDAEDDADADTTNGSMSMLMHDHEERRKSGEDIYFDELASYGGHLNRFTFLKNAKYAGPNDEYICTGSDSGHAWIYERSTGAVVSLLNADHSTCNGVVPHPSLPFFITYGIDSTAKLWRGTGPVDNNADDSAHGRARAFREMPYEMSPLTKDWDTIEREISNIEQELAEADAARENDSDDDDEDETDNERKESSLTKSYNILPDQVLSRKELINTGSLGRSILRRFYTPGGAGGTRVGNDLHSLPDVLRRNQYECIRGAVGGGVGRRSDLPVESDLKELMRRVSLIRLRHQADRQGIAAHWSPCLPWIMGTSSTNDDQMTLEDEKMESENEKSSCGIHPADLVPDNPSDWIPYDPEMSKDARECGVSFNCKEYGDFYRERYLVSDRSEQSEVSELASTVAWRRDASDAETSSSSLSASENAYKILHETARVLKDGGNEALRKGELDIAARRYDKAIRYCSVAFMSHNSASSYGGKYEDELMLISMKMLELDIESDHTVTPLMLKWSPLLKVLISTRLNLSMLLLKQAKHQREVPQLEQALDQARHALRELQPFCTQKGKICVTYIKSGSGGRLCTSGAISSCSKARVKVEVLKSQEPLETYKEAKTLEAKAYFRLGSAHADMGDYGEVIKSFDKSTECTLELNPDAKLDPLVVRRLAEAKREKARQNKRHRKKFRMMFAQDEDDSADKKTKESKEPKSGGSPGTGSRGRQKDCSRRRTTPIVSPNTPSSTAHTPAAEEDRGTQSE